MLQLIGKKNEVFNHVKTTFEKYLKKNGYRQTIERLAILEFVYAQKKPFDAEFMFTELEQIFRISKATVYNTINLLLECNLIKVHVLGNGKVNYEKAYQNNKFYIVCAQCSVMKEFKDEYLQTYLSNKTFRAFTSNHYSLYMYGLCSKCVKKDAE